MTVFKLGMRDSNEMLCAGWLKVNMKFMLKIKICVLSLMAVAVTGHAQSVKADEKGLWDVWCGGTNSAFEASEMAKACKKFRTSAPQDPFTVVVSGLEAWNHLKKGDTGTATAIFWRRASMLSSMTGSKLPNGKRR